MMGGRREKKQVERLCDDGRKKGKETGREIVLMMGARGGNETGREIVLMMGGRRSGVRKRGRGGEGEREEESGIVEEKNRE